MVEHEWQVPVLSSMHVAAIVSKKMNLSMAPFSSHHREANKTKHCSVGKLHVLARRAI
jgi:hypothetical protein